MDGRENEITARATWYKHGFKKVLSSIMWVKQYILQITIIGAVNHSQLGGLLLFCPD